MMKNTLLLSLNDASDRAQAASLLLDGKLVAIPTETVYGLAASARNESAIRAVFAAKKRPSDHPLILHIGHIEQLKDWVTSVPPAAYQFAEQCWPGPLTMILPKAAGVSPLITGGRQSIAVRMPDKALLCQLLCESGPVVAPSANLHKKISPTCAQQVLSGLGGRIDAILDGGDCELGLESTIVDLTRQPIQILRAGPIFPKQLSDIIGQDVTLPTAHNIAVAGNLPAHYQPETPAFLYATDDLVKKLQGRGKKEPRTVVLHYSDLVVPAHIKADRLPANRQAYGKQLYQALARADTQNCAEIWIEQAPSQWHEVIDRLTRACFR